MKAFLSLFVLLFAGMVHAGQVEQYPYAAPASCATADSTYGAVVLLELTQETASCALRVAASEPQVYLVTSSSHIAAIAAEVVPGKILLTGPAICGEQKNPADKPCNVALAGAEHVNMALTYMVERYNTYNYGRLLRDLRPVDVSPPEALDIAAKHFGWRRV